jgi:hypothetical protein
MKLEQAERIAQKLVDRIKARTIRSKFWGASGGFCLDFDPQSWILLL